MTTLDPKNPFSDRYKTFNDLITLAISTTDGKSYPNLVGLLNDLLQFADKYSTYFLNQPNITRSELNIVLTRLQEEWSRISRACDQRRSATFQTILSTTDAHASLYYNRFRGYKTNKDVAPITYIEKAFEITRFTFTSYPLMSVPFLFIKEEENIQQSLAHEMGHFIYWNSAPLSQYQGVQTRLKAEVVNQLNTSAPTNNFKQFKGWQDLSQRWEKWFEETFADICGTLFGFQGFFKSACDIASDMSLSNLIYDDNEHPVYFLRPFIALETLRWMAQQPTHQGFVPNASAINDLKAQWLQKLSDDGIDQNHTTFELPIDLVQKTVSIVVGAILEKSLWVGKNQGMDGKQEPARLGDLILPTAEVTRHQEKDISSQILVEPEPFDQLRNAVEQHITADNDKKNITLDADRLGLLVRDALINLDLGDESGKIIGPRLPPRPH